MLTDLQVSKLKPAATSKKYHDERNMFLLVSHTGAKLWRLKYTIRGKETQLSLGRYPEVSLKLARERRDAARRLLADGRDPGAEQRALKGAISVETTFEGVAREWLAKKTSWAPSHTSNIVRFLERDVFPSIGTRPVGEVTPAESVSYTHLTLPTIYSV